MSKTYLAFRVYDWAKKPASPGTLTAGKATWWLLKWMAILQLALIVLALAGVLLLIGFLAELITGKPRGRHAHGRILTAPRSRGGE